MSGKQIQHQGNRSSNKASFPIKLHSPQTEGLKVRRSLSTSGEPADRNKQLNSEPGTSEYSYLYDNQDSISDMASETGYYSMSGYQEESIFDSESYEDNFDLDSNTPSEPLSLVTTHVESQKQASPTGYNPIDLSLNHALDLTVRMDAMDYRVSSVSPQPIEISDDSMSETGNSSVGVSQKEVSQKGLSQNKRNPLGMSSNSGNATERVFHGEGSSPVRFKLDSVSMDSQRVIPGSRSISPDSFGARQDSSRTASSSHKIWYVRMCSLCYEHFI